MKLEREKDTVERLLLVASQRWGEEEARVLRPALERTTEAIRDVECFELDPGDEPWRPPREE
jgi:hypothetical protein